METEDLPGLVLDSPDSIELKVSRPNSCFGVEMTETPQGQGIFKKRLKTHKIFSHIKNLCMKAIIRLENKNMVNIWLHSVVLIGLQKQQRFVVLSFFHE